MPSDYEAILKENLRRFGDEDPPDHLLPLKDLYSKQIHFLLELVQNADDAKATELTFDLYGDRLEVEHDGSRLFSEADVEAITAVGKSTKPEELTAIGRFGLGFKSVFAFTESPIIHSGDEHFMIEKLIRPRGVEAVDCGLMTRIILQFNCAEKDPTTARRQIGDALKKLEPSTLLFVQHLQRVRIRFDGQEYRQVVREVESTEFGVAQVVGVWDPAVDDSKQRFAVWRRVPAGLEHRRIELAALLDGGRIQPLDHSPLVVFFKTEKETHLPFLVQGPYRTTPARDNIPEDDPDNISLVAQSADHLAEVVGHIGATGCLSAGLLNRLPLSEVDFGPDSMFAPFLRVTLELLRDRNAIPVAGGSYARAAKVALTVDRELRGLLSTEQLGRLHDGRQWADLSVDELQTPSLWGALHQQLGVPILNAGDILAHVDEDFLRHQTSDWVVQLLVYLNEDPSGVTEERVCRWLADHLPEGKVNRTEAPPLVQDDHCVRAVLRYFKGRGRAAMLAPAPCNDGTLRFAGDDEPRRLPEKFVDLAAGLGGLLTDHIFEEEGLIPKWVKAIDGKWLAARLVAVADDCIGRSLGDQLPGPLRSMENATTALREIIKSGAALDGVPLAVDPNELAHTFDDHVVVGLPAERARQDAEALLTALRLRPLHKALDLPTLSTEVAVFSTALVRDRLQQLEGGLSPDLTGSLLEVMAWTCSSERRSSSSRQAIKLLRVWPGSDGESHRLDAPLYLPPDEPGDPLTSSVLTVASGVCDGSHADRRRRVLADLLKVEPFDRTTIAIEACKSGPDTPEHAVALIEELVKADAESWRLEVLREATFVPCNGGFHKPVDAFVSEVNLPMHLWDRGVVEAITDNSMAIELLCEKLDAPRLPPPAEIISLARQLEDAPVDGEQDNSVEVLNFLKNNWSSYADDASSLARLAAMSWLVPKSGGPRTSPEGMIAEHLSHASICWPVTPVGNLQQSLSTLLRIKTDLTAEDLAKVANEAAGTGHHLAANFFEALDKAARTDASVIGALDNVAFLPAGCPQSLYKPVDFTTAGRSKVWGHLRTKLPKERRELKNLIEVWGIGSEGAEGQPAEHLDVLSELAGNPRWTSKDSELAQDRIKSLASMSPNGAEAARRLDVPAVITDIRPYVEASNNYCLVRPDDGVLRANLPPDVVKHLRPRLHLANPVDKPIDGFGEAAERLALELGVPSLRDEIELTAEHDGLPRDHVNWWIRLKAQKENLIRFLLASSDGMDTEQRELWPPVVRSVDNLRIQATRNGELIVAWPERAFLHEMGSEVVLYVQGPEVTADDLAAAIDARFGLRAGNLALLEKILSTDDPASAAATLAKNNIPEIPADEFVPEPRVLPEAEGPTPGGEPVSGKDGVGSTEEPAESDEPEVEDDAEKRSDLGIGRGDPETSRDIHGESTPQGQPGPGSFRGLGDSISGGTSSGRSGGGDGASGAASSGRTSTEGSGGAARGPQEGRTPLIDDRSATSGAASSPHGRRQRSMADASRRRKRTKEEIKRKIDSEPEKERRFRITDRTVFEANAPEVRDFLKNEYDGECQICGSTFPQHDGEPFFNATLCTSFREKRMASDPGGAWCLCPTCHAKFRHGARRWLRPFTKQILGSIGSGNPLTLEVELCGERVQMEFSPNHTIAIQEWTDAVIGLSDWEATDDAF